MPATTATIGPVTKKRRLRAVGRGQPEGPFEGGDVLGHRGVTSEELSHFLDFVEAMESEAERILSVKRGYSETKMLVTLLRNHLAGMLTTTSRLTSASGLGYGTAIRAIKSMEERGLLIRRPRTQTGKSFSLHPSEKLIAEWQEYARRMHGVLSGIFGAVSARNGGLQDYYFGASYSSGKTLPPPSALATKLQLQKELRILVHADPTFMAMNALKKQFESLLGIGINSRALSIDRLREEILSNAAAKRSRYDIIASDLPWFGEMAMRGALLPIDRLIGDSGMDVDDFHPVALASARYKGIQYGLPVQTTPELLVARRDLLEDAGLPLPKTAAQALDAARALHMRTSGRSGIAWNGARGTPLGHTFLFVMGAFGQPFLNLERIGSAFDGENLAGENFRPMFRSNAACETAEYLRELLDYSPPGILSMSWYERARAYADGDVAMAYCATLLAPLFELNEKSPAHGVTAYLPHPHGPRGVPVAPVGGYALGIPSNIESHRIEAIWTALRTFTSPESIKLYIENGSLVSPRFSVNMDPEVRRVSPLISIVDGMARTGVLQMWPRPPVPEITDIIAIIGQEAHDMLQGAASVDVALDNAQNRADALMRSRGHY